MINDLPPAPSRGDDPDVFVGRADAWMAALPGFGTQANQLAEKFNTVAGIGNLGYLPPVAYAAGIAMTVGVQQVEYAGVTYAPLLDALPFTTSGTFEAGKFRVVQGVTAGQLAEPDGSEGIGFQQAGVDSNGARERRVKDRLREAVHVTDYPGIDPTGTADSSAAITSARVASDYPYAPPGNYVLNNTGRLAGLWGPGWVVVGGKKIRLPAAPRRTELISAIQAKMVRTSMSGGTMLLVADSIGEEILADSTVAESWFNLLLGMLNAYASPEGGSEPEVTNFGDPSRYNLGYAGSYAVGGAGPIGKSLVLQPGASITFSGKYQYVDVMAERSPGAGALAMRRNGVVFKTVNMNAAAESDWCSFPSATGSGTAPDDVYTLTATGAAVELTGIWRLGNVGTPGIFASRCALSGSSTTLHSQDARIASVIKHSRALSPSATPLIFVALCINNANGVAGVGTSPDEYGAHLAKMFARYISSGAYVIAIGGILPAESWGVVRTNYPAIAAMQKKICEQYGVPLIAQDAYAWLREGGALVDGLHPNKYPGQIIYLDMILDTLASPAFNLAGGTQSYCLTQKDGLPLSWYGTGAIAAVATVSNVRWWRAGPIVHVIANLSGINPTAAGSSGPLCIGMPTFSNSVLRGSGTIGQCKGFLGSTGKYWTLQTVGGGGNLAVLRSIDPVTGTESDVTSISAGASIDLHISYIERD